MSNSDKVKQTLLERQFAQAARMVKAAIEEYPILADDTAPMFQLAVAVIREELDYKRQVRAEREAVAEATNPAGVRFPIAMMNRLAKGEIRGEG